jgi:DNA primase
VGVRTGPEFMAHCLWHDNQHSPALQINAETGLFVCFSCGKAGNIKTLEREFGVRAGEVEVDVSEIVARLNALEAQSGAPVQLPPIPEAMVKRYQFNRDYWHGRNLTDVTIDAFDLGFDLFNDMATIAIRDQHGRLLGFIKRDMDPDTTMRYKYPKHFKKSLELFGSWFAKVAATDTCVVVEGSVDCAAVWQAGFCCVAQYGTSISAAQIKMLRQFGFTEVILFYDNDRAGKQGVQRSLGYFTHKSHGEYHTEYRPRSDMRRDFLVRVAQYRRGMKGDPAANNSLDIALAITTARHVP